MRFIFFKPRENCLDGIDRLRNYLQESFVKVHRYQNLRGLLNDILENKKKFYSVV